MPKLYRFLATVVCLIVVQAGAAADVSLSFHASFDGTTGADVCRSGSATPTLERGVKLVAGIRGQAVYIGGSRRLPWAKSPALEYDAGEHFRSEEGTVGS